MRRIRVCDRYLVNDFCVSLPGNGAINSSCYFSSLCCIPSKRKGRCSTVAQIFRYVFQNQGINPVGDHARVPRTCTNKQELRSQRDKWLLIPLRSLTRVRSDRDDSLYFWYFCFNKTANKSGKVKQMQIDMLRIDPGAIVFSSGFSHDSDILRQVNKLLSSN